MNIYATVVKSLMYAYDNHQISYDAYAEACAIVDKIADLEKHEDS